MYAPVSWIEQTIGHIFILEPYVLNTLVILNLTYWLEVFRTCPGRPVQPMAMQLGVDVMIVNVIVINLCVQYFSSYRSY